MERPPLTSRLLRVSELGSLPSTEPLVDGLLYRGTLAQLSGPAGSYKSFAAVGWACAVALGENWEGHLVPSAGRVLYVAAEGASGLEVRVKAWATLSGHDPRELDEMLFILPDAVNLGRRLDVSLAMELVAELKPVLIILDTRARCTVGLDENSAKEQGIAIQEIEHIRQSAGATSTVVVLHHSGRNGTTPRGSTAWDGAVWSDLRLTGSDQHAAITAAKHKDAESGQTTHYRLVSHEVPELHMPGRSEIERTSLVIVSNAGETEHASNSRSVSALRELVETCATESGIAPSELIRLGEEAAGLSRASAFRARKVLIEKGIVTNVGTTKRPRYVLSNQPELGYPRGA